MAQFVSAFTILVPTYEQGLDFYVSKLGFELIEDTKLSDVKRWVVVAPKGSKETRIILAQPSTPEQDQALGNQTGGRVGFFLTTDNFNADYARMLGAGVSFLEIPRDEAYAKVVVFQDPFGNKWDLLQPK